MIGYYVWRTLQGGAAIQISSIRGVANAPAHGALLPAPSALCSPHGSLRPARRRTGAPAGRRTEHLDQHRGQSTSCWPSTSRPRCWPGTSSPTASRPPRRSPDLSSQTVTATDIGLVAFAAEAFTQSPLTTDQSTLQTLLSRIPQRTDRRQRYGHRKRARHGHQPACARKRRQSRRS